MWFLIWNLSALEKMVPILHFPLELDGCLGLGYHLEQACPLWLLPLSFEDLQQQCNGNRSHFSPLYWEQSSITHPMISFSQVNICLWHAHSLKDMGLISSSHSSITVSAKVLPRDSTPAACSSALSVSVFSLAWGVPSFLCDVTLINPNCFGWFNDSGSSFTTPSCLDATPIARGVQTFCKEGQI